MKDEQGSEAERDTRNKGLQHEEEQLHDPEKRTPHSTADQAAPEQERMVTPQEEAEDDVAHMENPPQAEGPRERNNDAV